MEAYAHKTCLSCNSQLNFQSPSLYYMTDCRHAGCSYDCLHRYFSSLSLLNQYQLRCPICGYELYGLVCEFFGRTVRALDSKEPSGGCQICKYPVSVEESLSLECVHMFHPDCLMNHISYQMESNGKVEIDCAVGDCKAKVNPLLIQTNFPQLYEAYIKLCETNIEVEPTAKVLYALSSRCKSLNCDYFAVVDRRITEVQCSNCNVTYCLECMNEAHPSLTCDEHQSFLQSTIKYSSPSTESWLSNQDPTTTRRCPVCKFILRREKNCKYVTCGSPVCKNKTFLCMGCGIQLKRSEEMHNCPVKGLDYRQARLPQMRKLK